jgi:hypothetical protein
MNLRSLKLRICLNWNQQEDDRSSSVPSCCRPLHFASETMCESAVVKIDFERIFAGNRLAVDPSCTDDSLGVPTGEIKVSTGALGSWEKCHRRNRIVQFDVLPRVTAITHDRKSLPFVRWKDNRLWPFLRLFSRLRCQRSDVRSIPRYCIRTTFYLNTSIFRFLLVS